MRRSASLSRLKLGEEEEEKRRKQRGPRVGKDGDVIRVCLCVIGRRHLVDVGKG